MPVQDDQRENELRELFGLVKGEGEGRAGTEAVLALGDIQIPFELKSTTRGSVTTVRDFGPDHITKWVGKHWLIGFYNQDGTELLYTVYGSPKRMKPWISLEQEYISTDISLAAIVPEHIGLPEMHHICGDKEVYSLADARRIQKKQYKKLRYQELMDVPGGYSPERMTQILRDRARYLILRGSTLNNPKIPKGYFTGWPRITENHAETLREMVLEALADTA